MLASGELARELDDHPELKEDIDLIRKQAERCRDILRELSHGGKDDSHVKAVPISAIIEEAAEPHRYRGKRMILRLDGALIEDADQNQPIIRRQPEVIHGLRNLVQNAVDFSRSTVWVDVKWTEETLRIVVGDDGPGFSADMLGRLGDPYVTHRSRLGLGARAKSGRAGYEGMGLGLFIAKTLLERTGARIEFANGSDRDARDSGGHENPPELTRPAGAIVIAEWPLAALASDHDRGRGVLADNPKFSLNNI
jgi:two-component system sensor histidine kinase RegB